MKNRRFKIVSAALLLASLLIIAWGCGSGGSKSPASSGRAGRLSLTAIWPKQTTRLIPQFTSSIQVTLSRNGENIGTRMLRRGEEEGGQESTVTFDNLAAGPVTLTATAYPEPEAVGVALATGAVPATIISEQTTRVTVTMASTIDRIEVTPENPSVAPGSRVRLMATPRDASGNVVLAPASNFAWTSGTPATATPFPEGGQAIEAVGAAIGTALFTVTESDSGKSGATTVTVGTGGTDACVPGPVTGPGGLANAPWPMAGHDPAKTNRGGAGGATGVLKWRVSTLPPGITGTGSGFTVIAADGNIYVGNSNTRSVFALNPEDGSRVREFTQLGPNPTLGANGLIYASNDSELIAVDFQTGVKRWSVPGAGSVIIGADGTVYSGTFRANAQGTNLSTVVALDGATGAEKWAVTQGNGVGAPSLGADGTVYASSVDGGLNALDGRCGTLKWTFNAPAGIFVTTTPSVGADATLYLRAVAPGGANSRLYALAPEGREKWQVDVPIGNNSPSIGADGTLYLVSNSGVFTAHDPANGAVKATYTATGPNITTFGAPAVASDNTIYFVVRTLQSSTTGGSGVVVSRLLAVDGTNGAMKWEFIVPGQFTSAQSAPVVVGPDGTVYLIDSDSAHILAVK